MNYMGISTADYIAILARSRNRVPQGLAPSQGVAKESDLHADIIQECRRRGWVYLHGSMAEATHRTSGEPDFVIAADGGKTYYIEAKSRIGKLSPAQNAMRAHLEKLRHTYHVVRSMEDFLNAIQAQSTALAPSVPIVPSP